MDFRKCYEKNRVILMEGAVGERLKGEYSVYPHSQVALAGHIYQESARQAMKNIYSQYIKIGIKYGYPMMLTTPTRRANQYNVGMSAYDENIIKDNVEFLKDLKKEIKAELETGPGLETGSGLETRSGLETGPEFKPGKDLKTDAELECGPEFRTEAKSKADVFESIFVGGLMGCKGDAYTGAGSLEAGEAYEFHSWQAQLFRKARADFLFAGIMPVLPEALGMARAMESAGLPYIISFMIRDNGRLIDGTPVSEAIAAIDGAVSQKPVCYMTNCVHPAVLRKALACSFNRTEAVRKRFAGIQANASPMTPEELERGGEILVSGYGELAEEMLGLQRECNLKIFGGCCGTDHIYMEEMAERLKETGRPADTRQ